jgi:hypothetical protein
MGHLPNNSHGNANDVTICILSVDIFFISNFKEFDQNYLFNNTYLIQFHMIHI